MSTLGYDADRTSTQVSGGSAAAVGNRIAECYIAYGLQDGANEAERLREPALSAGQSADRTAEARQPGIVDLDRWQPIALVQYVDQAGNVINSQPPALTPEWGAVAPFSLTDADKSRTSARRLRLQRLPRSRARRRARSGTDADIYKWAFALVAVWSGHLDQTTA